MPIVVVVVDNGQAPTTMGVVEEDCYNCVSHIFPVCVSSLVSPIQEPPVTAARRDNGTNCHQIKTKIIQVRQ
jgi:hypothetical protein